MRFFKNLDESLYQKVFYKEPQEFLMSDEKNILSNCLGATLYMPATRKNIADDFINIKYPDLTSVIICAEDAVGDFELDYAESNILEIFEKLESSIQCNIVDKSILPLIFIRVKDINCFKRILENAHKMSTLCGFVFPKISSCNIEEYLQLLENFNVINSKNLYAMPVFETSNIIYKENRIEELLKLKLILDKYRDLILNIRIGATDFSSLFSLRKTYNQTIYDISVIRDCISDIINIFKRAENEYVISGCVFEYFNIETSKFINEILLDKANGLTGKTIIHPSQINIVNALHVVSYEEYDDAKTILQCTSNGVLKSNYNNKMNEPKPHTLWAKKIITKSKIYGVLNEKYDYTCLFNK